MAFEPLLDLLFRWLHVGSGIMWIGLLWYFNFVQVPSMAQIPDDQKPAVTKVIAPRALWWFRWAAISTVVFGLLLALLPSQGYLFSALALGLGSNSAIDATIGFGMWLGLIMATNVWLVIWPSQQKVLGLREAGADEKKRAARTALLASRTNTMLSIPMLFAMVGLRHVDVVFL